MVLVITALLSGIVYAVPEPLARLFSNDRVSGARCPHSVDLVGCHDDSQCCSPVCATLQEIHTIFRETAGYLALTIFFMSTSDCLEQVIMAQGRAKSVAIATTVASWCVCRAGPWRWEGSPFGHAVAKR